MTGSAPARSPDGPGCFAVRRTANGFVKNLSKSVQESFTNETGGCGILWMSEGKTPSLRRTPFYTLFSFFHLFFLPSFSFLHGMRPVSRVGNRAFPCLCGARCNCNKSFTGYSKSVHTFRPAVGYTEYVSKGSRNPEAGKPTDLLFLFYPPFSNLCSESAKRRCPVSPNGQRRFALWVRRKRRGRAGGAAGAS